MGRDNQTLMPTYQRLSVGFVRGEGVWLWDEAGNRYLDALSGIAVAGLGHAHSAVAAAIADQAQTLLHTSNIYRIPLQEQLGDRLCDLSQMERVFFCNSGAEANEAAIKIARRYGHQRGVELPTIIVADNAFHGRTMATLTATGNRKAHAGFEPLVAGFIRVPYDDLEAVEQVAGNESNVVAVLIEPVQGEGGINIPDPGYLQGLREICDRHQWLLMLDEIQTGMGRTGEWFAWQHTGVRPDVMTLAKALGNGVPIGACLARDEAAAVLVPGTHGSTFGGNHLACRAALAVVDVLSQESMPERAAQLGVSMLQGLGEAIGDHPRVRAIRGTGLMLGIEFDTPCGDLVSLALDQGLLINVTAGSVVRLLPPLIYEQEHVSLLVERLAAAVQTFGEQQ
jgi:acetylornithine/N-succinyldiaminopimelate aminotransferase